MTAIEDARAARRGLQLGYPKPAHRPVVVQEAMDALDTLIAEHERLTTEYERSESARRVALEGVQTDYLSIEDLGEAMSAASDRWDGDEAMHAIVLRFIEHYAALDSAIDSARAADDYDDATPILFRWDSDRASLTLTAPPTDDEREALARILDDNDPEGGVTPDPEGGTWEWWLPQVDAVLAAGFRRQGPITDEWEYGVSEVLDDGVVAYGYAVPTEVEARARQDAMRRSYPWPEEIGLARRRKAGPWEPVEARDAS